MTYSIYPCICIKGKVAEAADFYIHAFGDGKILQTSTYVVAIELSGEKLMLLNEGSNASPNASISFMVISETAAETAHYHNKLMEGGNILMPLDRYDWSENYSWVADKYGVSWQLYTGRKADTPQKFCPTLMFTGVNAGKASAAVHFYTQLFPDSKIEGIMKYGAADEEDSNLVKHAQFSIKDFIAMATDSSADHGFNFNAAVSFVVECNSQNEIDKYWNTLIADGGMEIACGWLVDKYGVSWQIIPRALGQLLKDPEKAKRIMKALMTMKKLIIQDLDNA
ncbi:MAG: VOC family protein [Sphingobacteriaceae bacterium]